MTDTDDEPGRQHKKPSEWTYLEYRQDVELAASVAIEARNEYPEDFGTLDEAVRYAIEGDSRFTNYGHMLMTVLLSDTDPDAPDYGERWQARADLGGDPTWPDLVGEMARVCYYSDVVEQMGRKLHDDGDEPDNGEGSA